MSTYPSSNTPAGQSLPASPGGISGKFTTRAQYNFAFNCMGTDGVSRTRKIDVVVDIPQPCSINFFTVNGGPGPVTIAPPPGAATLQWDISGPFALTSRIASYSYIGPFPGTTPSWPPPPPSPWPTPSGTIPATGTRVGTFSIEGTYNFTITCVGSDGVPQTQTRTVVIPPAVPPPPAGETPYFRVYGGDVAAGGAFMTGATCPAPGTGAIIAYTKDLAAGGAGVQFAALALAQITEFSSASLRPTAAPSSPAPLGLTLANNGLAAADITYPAMGGWFGTGRCVPDYFNDTRTVSLVSHAGPFSVDPATLAPHTQSGHQMVSDVLVLVGGTAPRHTLYVEGDVFIQNNVTTASSWASVADIPFFTLVVKGNIYISKDVGQLNGWFIAQPNGATGGTIYTCSDPGAPRTAYTGPGLKANCEGNQLLVNGAFTAQQVKLLRTKGTLTAAGIGELASSPNIAEVFNFSPEMYFVPPVFKANNTFGAGYYDFITTLPPVL